MSAVVLIFAEMAAISGTATVYGLAMIFLHPPSPATGLIESGKPQLQYSGAKQQANNDQRAAPDLPVIVRVLPTEKAGAEAAENEAERFYKSFEDWGMLGFTGLSTFIFLAQLFVSGPFRFSGGC
jgi:hypothetical protein